MYKKRHDSMKKNLVVVIVLIFSIFLVLTAVGAESDQESIGNWIVTAEKDPLTDELFVGMGAPSDKYRESKGSEGVLLTIRFEEGSPRLFLIARERLGKQKVLYRFDEGEVQEDKWILSESKKYIVFPSDNFPGYERDLEIFVKKIIRAEEFIVGIYPEGKRRESYVFKTNGLSEAISPYLEEFGWEDLEETIEEEKE